MAASLVSALANTDAELAAQPMLASEPQMLGDGSPVLCAALAFGLGVTLTAAAFLIGYEMGKGAPVEN